MRVIKAGRKEQLMCVSVGIVVLAPNKCQCFSEWRLEGSGVVARGQCRDSVRMVPTLGSFRKVCQWQPVED